MLGPATTECLSTVSPGVQTTDSAAQLQNNFTDLANGLVGALTQACQASSQTAHNQDNDLRRLTAQQASVNVTLPEVSGKAEEWPAFIRVFRTSTQQCGFSNAENVQWLQQCLKGPAKEAVRLQLAVPDNVAEAIKTLERWFGRPELVVGELIAKAKSFRPVRADDTDALLAFTTAVNNVVMTMYLLNSPGHLANPALRQELVDQLPSSFRHLWGEHLQLACPQHSPDLAQFAKWLSARADAAALVAPPRPATTTTVTKPTHRTLHASPSQSGQGSSPSCLKCGGHHLISACKQFEALTLYKHWDLVYNLGLCSCCLARGHWKQCAPNLDVPSTRATTTTCCIKTGGSPRVKATQEQAHRRTRLSQVVRLQHLTSRHLVSSRQKPCMLLRVQSRRWCLS